jgi:hypothetical protein
VGIAGVLGPSAAASPCQQVLHPVGRRPGAIKKILELPCRARARAYTYTYTGGDLTRGMCVRSGGGKRTGVLHPALPTRASAPRDLQADSGCALRPGWGVEGPRRGKPASLLGPRHITHSRMYISARSQHARDLNHGLSHAAYLACGWDAM